MTSRSHHSGGACPATVVVLGGYGFFGRLVVEDILRFTDARVVVAGRRPPRRLNVDVRVSARACDIDDSVSLARILEDACVIVHCAGPYQRLPLGPLKAAIAHHVHYVDLADDREFVRRLYEHDDAAKKAGISVMTGASVVPGMSAIFTNLIWKHFDKLDSVRTFVAPGTSRSRGAATLLSLLSGVGRPFRVPRNGHDVEVFGWTEPEWVEFPSPVGRRLLHLAIPVADFDILPRVFGVGSVEFKAGSEFAWLNRSLHVAGRMRRRMGHPQLERWVSVFRQLIRLLGVFGTDRGAVLCEFVGRIGSNRESIQLAVTADSEGHHIPAVLAGIATSDLIRGKIASAGVVPLHEWMGATRIKDEFSRRGMNLLWKPHPAKAWEPFTN